MKKLKLIILLMVLGVGTVLAQAPHLFNYQGVARDTKGAPLANQTLGLQLSILSAENATVSDYTETQTVTTNEFGLYTLKVGEGTPINGTLKMVNWESGSKYLKVEIDPKGGTNYTTAGNAQLLSVPYAIFANKAKVAGSGSRSGGVVTAPGTTGTGNHVPKFNGTPNTLTNSRIIDNGTRLGFGTTSPGYEASFVSPTTNTLEIKSNATNSYSRVRFHADGTSPSNSLIFNKFGSSAAGTYMGFPRSNMSAVINSGTDPSDFVFVSNRTFAIGTYTGSATLERMRVSPLGLVGISEQAPEAGLHVSNSSTTGHNTALFTMYPSILGQNTASNIVNVGLLGTATGSSSYNIGVLGDNVDTNQVGYGVFGRISRASSSGLSAGILAYDAVNSSNTRSLITRGGLAEFESQTEFNNNATFNSPIQYTSGTPALGKVMTSDASGNASWQNLPASVSGTGVVNRLSKWTAANTLGSTGILENASGDVGIGITTPGSKLDVSGAITVTGGSNTVEGGRLQFNEFPNQNTGSDTSFYGMGFHYNGSTNYLSLTGGYPTQTEHMRIYRSGGKVIIGSVSSTPGTYKLYVEDGILTERVKVAVDGSGNWADYVFAPDYKLMPLEEVDDFIQKNKHLPNVPSAEKMAETGIDVATMDAKLMEKIEELTLYMIQMKKEIKTLKKQNETLKSTLKK